MKLIVSRSDFVTSVFEALDNIDTKWHKYNGLILVGTHAPKKNDIEEKIDAIRKARESGLPFLGICFGFQLMLIEYARNVLGIKEATTKELYPNTKEPVIAKLPALRVGIRPVTWQGETRMESHWHKYAFARRYAERFSSDWELSFTDGILEVARLRDNNFFMGTQFHPEYQSSKSNPHPILKEFINECKKKHNKI